VRQREREREVLDLHQTVQMPSVFISFRHSCFSSSSRLSHRISLGHIWSPQNGWLGLPALSKKGAAETADSPIQAFAPRTCFKALSRRHDGDRYPPASRSSCRLVQGIRQRDTLTTPGRRRGGGTRDGGGAGQGEMEESMRCLLQKILVSGLHAETLVWLGWPRAKKAVGILTH